MLEGGGAALQQDVRTGFTWDTTAFAQSCLLTFLERVKNLYRFLLHNSCKPSVVERGQSDDAKAHCDLYIERTYPCNRLSRWETEGPNPYGGRQTPSNRSLSSGGTPAPAGAGNSLSCRAVLGLILTKAIYLLQDTDRLGLHLQLVTASLSTLEHVFSLSTTQEFSELLHLCLFAFDKVCDFYKEQLFEEVLVQPVLNALIRVIGLLNGVPTEVPQVDSAASERSASEQSLAVRFKQPFTETFYRNTENVQRAVRRAIFRSHFSENTASYSTILTFFDLLESSEHIDQSNMMQRNVRKSFKKAQASFLKFLDVCEFRITSQNTLGEDQASLVADSRAFDEALSVIRSFTECGLDLKLEFPFEHLLADAVMFGGLAEEAGSGSNRLAELEQVTQLLLAIPVPAVRERILRKIY